MPWARHVGHLDRLGRHREVDTSSRLLGDSQPTLVSVAMTEVALSVLGTGSLTFHPRSTQLKYDATLGVKIAENGDAT